VILRGQEYGIANEQVIRKPKRDKRVDPNKKRDQNGKNQHSNRVGPKQKRGMI